MGRDECGMGSDDDGWGANMAQHSMHPANASPTHPSNHTSCHNAHAITCLIAWRMGVDGWQHTSGMGNGASTQLLVAMAATTPASTILISLNLPAHACMGD